MKAKAINRAYTINGTPCVTFEITDKSFLDSELLDGREIDLTVKPFRRKRSLNANAYMWTLINEIASVLGSTNDEIYHKELCRYGTFKNTDGAVEVITMRSDIKLQGWLYIHTKPLKTAELNGKIYTHYAIIKGTSEYDTKEMSVMLDGIIEDCKELGIQTMTPEEMERLNGYEVSYSR